MEPGTTFDGWAARAHLQLVEIDTAAVDGRSGIEPGPLQREYRVGNWASPGFAENSPVISAEPRDLDGVAARALGGKDEARALLREVLLQTIVEIAGTPLLLQEEDSRSGEVGPRSSTRSGSRAMTRRPSIRCSRRCR